MERNFNEKIRKKKEMKIREAIRFGYIHLDTKENGYLAIETGEQFLKEQEENLLYKEFGVRVSGKQNVETGEMDTKSLKLIELIDYQPKFDGDYLNRLITKARKNWKGINPDEWLLNLRGGYDS